MESLRRLLLGASSMDSRRLFDRKKQRYTVDKSIGKEDNFYVYRFVIYKDNHFYLNSTLGSHTGCFMTLNANLQWDNN